MIEPPVPPSTQPPDPLAPSVKLWTPNAISVLTFLLGYPGGVALACINWMRMGFKKRAYAHLIAFLVGTVVLMVILVLSPGGTSRWLGLGVNLAITFYLYDRMSKDIAMFKGIYPNVEDSHWSSGCWISLLGMVLLLGISFFVGIFLFFIGVPIPN